MVLTFVLFKVKSVGSGNLETKFGLTSV